MVNASSVSAPACHFCDYWVMEYCAVEPHAADSSNASTPCVSAGVADESREAGVATEMCAHTMPVPAAHGESVQACLHPEAQLLLDAKSISRAMHKIEAISTPALRSDSPALLSPISKTGSTTKERRIPLAAIQALSQAKMIWQQVEDGRRSGSWKISGEKVLTGGARSQEDFPDRARSLTFKSSTVSSDECLIDLHRPYQGSTISLSSILGGADKNGVPVLGRQCRGDSGDGLFSSRRISAMSTSRGFSKPPLDVLEDSCIYSRVHMIDNLLSNVVTGDRQGMQHDGVSCNGEVVLEVDGDRYYTDSAKKYFHFRRIDAE